MATRGWFELATRTLVAQQVERWTLDPSVTGSSPAEGKKTDFSSSSFIFSSRYPCSSVGRALDF